MKDLAPIVRSIRDSASPFALNLVQNENIQSHHYQIRSKETASGSNSCFSWYVARINPERSGQNRNEPTDVMASGELVEVQSEASSSDLISKSFWQRPHETTMMGCTCQFPTRWGVPCRHILRLFSVLQIQYLSAHIDDQWKCITTKESCSTVFAGDSFGKNELESPRSLCTAMRRILRTCSYCQRFRKVDTKSSTNSSRSPGKLSFTGLQ
jgi:hypothetical protein